MVTSCSLLQIYSQWVFSMDKELRCVICLPLIASKRTHRVTLRSMLVSKVLQYLIMMLQCWKTQLMIWTKTSDNGLSNTALSSAGSKSQILSIQPDHTLSTLTSGLTTARESTLQRWLLQLSSSLTTILVVLRSLERTSTSWQRVRILGNSPVWPPSMTQPSNPRWRPGTSNVKIVLIALISTKLTALIQLISLRLELMSGTQLSNGSRKTHKRKDS